MEILPCTTPPSAAPASRSAPPGSAPAASSRLGLKTGLTEEQSAGLIHEAFDLGVNFIDTAPSYGTEGVVGKALKTLPRDKIVVATKAQIGRNGNFVPAERVVASLDKSLADMGIDHVDVFNLHGIEPQEYDYALSAIAPALVREKEKGKIRHIGLTENPITDHTNVTLARALNDGVWEVVMVGFSMLHQGARTRVFPLTQANGIGTLLMFAVRSIFADPPRVARELPRWRSRAWSRSRWARRTTRSASWCTRAARRT